MNAPQRVGLPDIQSQIDGRSVAIDEVGIKGVRYPVTVLARGEPQSTVAAFSMTVALPASAKGTHMSRFVEILEAHREPLDPARFAAMARAMLERLDARAGTIEMTFPYFVRKTAPVSAVASLLDYEVTWRAHCRLDGASRLTTRVMVPATSLCPCSKEISAYGAHNQRSHITIAVRLEGGAPPVGIAELIRVAEDEASSELYGLLKRPDEKFVTERAYDNPKFVEDLVRDVAVALDRDPRVGAYTVEAENFESIHNHSAYALIERDKDLEP